MQLGATVPVPMDHPIYIVENHEESFYFWCKAKKEMGIDESFLVMVDKHSDLSEWGKRQDFREEINQLDLTNLERIKKLASLPRGDMQPHRISYMQPVAAMEAGLVGDMLLVSPEPPYLKIYEDLSKRKHRIFHCTHPNRLKDLLKKDELLRKRMGYPKGANSIILDIDLDFFTCLDENKVPHVVKENRFKEIFSNESVLWWVYGKAKLVTVSKEPIWCGGIDNSEHILNLLKMYFLNKKYRFENISNGSNKRENFAYSQTSHSLSRKYF